MLRKGRESPQQQHVRTSWVQSSGLDVINILQIKWACPPRFRVNPNWKMEAGSESQETQIQIQRESTTPQVIYLHNSHIPPNPSVAPDALNFNRDYISIPIIPLNDETTPTKVEKTTTQPFLQRYEVIKKAVTLVALIKSKDPDNQIDLALLIQLLQNPGMLQELMKEHGLSTNQETPSVTVMSANTRIPFAHRNLESQMEGLTGIDVGKVRKLINEYGGDSVKFGGTKDSDYNRRLVSEHGRMREERRTCVYFNSSKGCMRGSSCWFRHVMEEKSVKRMKLSGGKFVSGT